MKNETVVTIQGFGTYLIASDKVQQLIAYLQSLKAVGINENTNSGGEQLLRG